MDNVTPAAHSPCHVRLSISASVLCSGKITPDGALLFSSCIYIAVLIVGCTLPDTMLRLIIAMSAAATLAYTPILKRMTAMKNLTVAFIIAASPLAGALATGMVRLQTTLYNAHAPIPCRVHCTTDEVGRSWQLDMLSQLTAILAFPGFCMCSAVVATVLSA